MNKERNARKDVEREMKERKKERNGYLGSKMETV